MGHSLPTRRCLLYRKFGLNINIGQGIRGKKYRVSGTAIGTYGGLVQEKVTRSITNRNRSGEIASNPTLTLKTEAMTTATVTLRFETRQQAETFAMLWARITKKGHIVGSGIENVEVILHNVTSEELAWINELTRP